MELKLISMTKGKYVYIIADINRTKFEAAISEQILVESWKCKAGLHPTAKSFGSKTEIVYYEYLTDSLEAINLVAELKSKPQEQLVDYIKHANPNLKDIYYDVWVTG
ncbi:hypothetical protein EP331_09160 [bacterium]|nr:MAG: hypothetical protein EP331_09160 [bacterium]